LLGKYIVPREEAGGSRKHGKTSAATPGSGFDSRSEPGLCVRARCSVHAGHDADNRSVWLDTCAGSGSGVEVGAVWRLRATTSASARRLANVSWQRLDKFRWLARRYDDRKCSQYLVHRSAGGLLSVLVADTEARQSGPVGMVGPNVARYSCWDHE